MSVWSGPSGLGRPSFSYPIHGNLTWIITNNDGLEHDHAITYLEMLVVLEPFGYRGLKIPGWYPSDGKKPVSGSGPVQWVEFKSPQALILPKRSRSAIAQSVVLAAIVQQFKQAFSAKMFPIPKKIGIKKRCHIWDIVICKNVQVLFGDPSFFSKGKRFRWLRLP